MAGGGRPIAAKAAYLLFSALLSAVFVPPAHADFAGRVINVADGDTLTVLVAKSQVKVRLDSIDAPESKQAFGTRSRQSLAELCAGKAASVADLGKDRYGRTIGRVTCAGTDANAEQVRRGMAWVFVRYAPKASPLYALESEAMATRRGLWADPHAVAPWEWRAAQKRRK